MAPKKFRISDSPRSGSGKTDDTNLKFKLLVDASPTNVEDKHFRPVTGGSSTTSAMIRRLADAKNPPKIDPRSEHIIYINEKTGEIVVSPLLLGLRPNVAAYLVSNEVPSERENFIVHLRDDASHRDLGISLSYRAYCKQGGERQLVSILYKFKSPTAGLDNLLRHWLQDFQRIELDSGRNLIADFDKMRAPLKSHLVALAADKAGINLQLTVSMELEALDLIKPYEMTAVRIPVRVHGYHENITLSIDGVFGVLSDRRVFAALNYEDLPRLDKRISEWVQEAILIDTTVEDFFADRLNFLTERLKLHLNEKLIAEGRKVDFLRISSDIAKQLERNFFQYKSSLSCTVRDCSDPVVVNHELLMNLVKPGKYQASGRVELESWAEKQLEKASRIVLLQTSYADLILDVERVQTMILHRVAAEAELIGFDVQHLVVIPSLEPLELMRDGFRIEETQEFTPQDSNERVRLRIVFTGRLGDLTAIRDHLRPQAHILNDLTRNLFNTVKDTIHKIDECRFYTRFSCSSVKGEIPVEELIRQNIERNLIEPFCIKGSNLIINPIDTEITERLKALQSGDHKVVVEVTPLRSGEPVDFHLRFKILWVDSTNWNAFRVNKYPNTAEEIKAISQVLHEGIRSRLDTIPAEKLHYEGFNELRDIVRIAGGAIDHIERTFGLVVEFVSFRRVQSKTEIASNEFFDTDIHINSDQQRARQDFASLKSSELREELKTLYTRKRHLSDALDGDEDQNELDTVNKRIEEIEKWMKLDSSSLLISARTNNQRGQSQYREDDYDKPLVGWSNARTDE